MSDSLLPHGLYSPWNSQARILEWVAFPSLGDLPIPGTEPRSRTLQADSSPAGPQWNTWGLVRALVVFFVHSVVSSSLRPQGLPHARLPCPSLSPTLVFGPRFWQLYHRDVCGEAVLGLSVLSLRLSYKSKTITDKMFTPSIPNKYSMKKIIASRHGYAVSFHPEGDFHVCVSCSVVTNSLWLHGL